MSNSTRTIRLARWLGAAALFAPGFSGCLFTTPSYDEFASGAAAGSAGVPVDAGGTMSTGGVSFDFGGLGSTFGGVGSDAGASNDAAGSAGISDAGATNGGGGSSAGGGAGAPSSAGSAGSGGAGCTSSGTEQCDNFESGAIDPLLWSVPKPATGVTVAVDSTRPHTGKYALHIHGVAGARNVGMLSENHTFPAKNNSFYVRIFAFFSPDLPQMQGGSYAIAFMYGTGKNDLGDTQTGMGVNGGSDQLLGYSIFFGPPFYQFGPWSSTRAVPGVWMCLELHEDGSHTDTEDRQVWLNDQELTELRSDSKTAAGTANANHYSPTYTAINVGLSEFTATPSLTDMWIDDVRISSQRIGCKL